MQGANTTSHDTVSMEPFVSKGMRTQYAQKIINVMINVVKCVTQRGANSLIWTISVILKTVAMHILKILIK